MKAHYLGHVVFYVKELKRSLAFYQDLLGFEQVGEMKHPFNACALTSGRTHHEILLIEVGAASPSQKGHRLGLYHIGIKVGDSLDELRTARDESGCFNLRHERPYGEPKFILGRSGRKRSRTLCG